MVSSLSRPDFINSLHTKLVSNPLPGFSAHQEMAHAIRRVDPQQQVHKARQAAVLLLLSEKSPGTFSIIFIRRVSGLDQDKHAGQIAFPGGKNEPDDPDMMYTAMREAEEEIGLDLSQIDILGPLSPLYITVSNFMVHPFVAFAWKLPMLTRQEREVEEIIEIPLTEFNSSSIRQLIRIKLATGITLNHVPCFQIHDLKIWGATAMIMNEFLKIHP